MNKQELVIVFIKNSIAGKVKTRLAKDIGDKQALTVYCQLLAHTQSVVASTPAKISIWYSDYIEVDDIFDNKKYIKRLQQGDDLGERMTNAFEWSFEQGYKRIVIIGSDCYDLTVQILDNSFGLLKKADLVIGPAFDGGYYLLGMKKLYLEIFANKNWSTDTVYQDTVNSIKQLGLSYKTTDKLSDIDNLNDLKQSRLGG